MTRLALRHNAVNLAQGFPDFAAPAEIKEAARASIARRQSVRHHLGRKTSARRHRREVRAYPRHYVDPERELP